MLEMQIVAGWQGRGDVVRDVDPFNRSHSLAFIARTSRDHAARGIKTVHLKLVPDGWLRLHIGPSSRIVHTAS